jgi:Ran GTPase-activating protein (RanGAP) involved in mRNA processing and transport
MFKYLLQSNVTIKELDLSGNDLSDKGAKYVAEALRENNTVEDLVGIIFLIIRSCTLAHGKDFFSNIFEMVKILISTV